MSGIQINRSPDLEKLEAEGFRLRIVRGAADHLLIEGIPAVTSAGEIVSGTLYCPLLTDANDVTINPVQNHQCWWIGELPHTADKRPMNELVSADQPENKGDGITTDFAFSRKRPNNTPYTDYHEKISTYVQLIWNEARTVDPDCDPRSEKPIPAVVEAQERAFHYSDTATTRAGIGAATARLVSDRIAIVGIGGSGSYVLDLLAKTPVAEIHIFDGDTFEVHNAFRAPGAPSKEELTDPLKVDWFGGIYNKMHKGIRRHPYYLDAGNIEELKGFDFVFVCVDKGDVRRVILNALIDMKVPFVDVGIDISLDDTASLRGQTRFTVGSADKNDHIEEVVSFGTSDADEVYKNIQVADLNMLNAAMAVGKWKQLRGFYADDVREHHSIYATSTHALSKEDRV